jgi:flagellar hook-associated protein 1 FlgK
MSTFSSLNTALTALQYNRVAMDVASSNIANASTDGYVRRRADAATLGGTATPAMWSRSTSQGDGVQVSGVSRMDDQLLDVRARNEHGKQSYLDIRQTVLERVESGIGEPSDTGVANALTAFRTSWHDLANNPGSAAARSEVLGKAATLVDAIHGQAANIATEESDDRTRIQGDVTQVNTLATNLADANRSIAVAQANGGDVNDLLDKRDQLAMQITQLTGATATARSDGGMDVSLNGVSLVSGATANTLGIASGINADGTADGNPITYAITSASGATPVPSGLTGEIGGLTDLLTTTLPGYASGLDAVAKQLADSVNSLHESGYDANGNPGTAFFSYDPTDPAASLQVAITDPNLLAASSVSGAANLDSGNATALAGLTGTDDAYQKLVNGFGTTVASVQGLAANQQVLTTQVDNAQQQLSGVSLDEEMVNMLSAQHAYEAASRVMTTVDSMLDTLINRTGVTH